MKCTYCNKPAVHAIKMEPPRKNVPVCQQHADSIMKKAVDGVMADPEIRAMFGLDSGETP